MAITSAADRKGVATVGLPLSAPGVTPDATPGKFWRVTVGWSRDPGAPSGSGQVPPASRYWTRYTAIDRNLGT